MLLNGLDVQDIESLWPVRISHEQFRKLDAMEDTESKLLVLRGEMPSAKEVAREMGRTVPEIENLRKMPRRGRPFDHVELYDPQWGSKPKRLKTSIPFTDPIEDAERRSGLQENIEKQLAYLPRDQRRVLEMHYGFITGKKMSYESIGAEMKGHPETIRQIAERGLRQLRMPVFTKKLRPYVDFRTS